MHLADIFSFCISLKVNRLLTYSCHTWIVVVWREGLSAIEVSKHLLRSSGAPYIKVAVQFMRGRMTPTQGTTASGHYKTTGPHRFGAGEVKAAAFQDSFVCSD